MNPYDEHAVTEAARLRSQLPGSEVIAVCLAKPEAENTLRSAMAMGADRSILVCTDGCPDSMLTARALAAAIQQDGSPDLILAGKESIDAEGMQTMFRLARHLGMPAATSAVKITLEAGAVVVECEKEAGSRDVPAPDNALRHRGRPGAQYAPLPDPARYLQGAETGGQKDRPGRSCRGAAGRGHGDPGPCAGRRKPGAQRDHWGSRVDGPGAGPDSPGGSQGSVAAMGCRAGEAAGPLREGPDAGKTCLKQSRWITP